MPQKTAGPTAPLPFASKPRAAAYVALAVLTSAMFPLFLWSGFLARESVMIPVGIGGVVVATAFKHFRLEPAEDKLSFRDRFCAATTRLGLRERAGATLFWVLLIAALGSFLVPVRGSRHGMRSRQVHRWPNGPRAHTIAA